MDRRFVMDCTHRNSLDESSENIHRKKFSVQRSIDSIFIAFDRLYLESKGFK